jgi:hypothetical protein
MNYGVKYAKGDVYFFYMLIAHQQPRFMMW